MTASEATELIERLTVRDAHGWHTWVDPTHVATDYWRTGALNAWRDEGLHRLDETDRPADVAAIELWLERPHPAFKVLVRMDAIGIWYGDGHGGGPDLPVERLGLIPWWQVSRLVLHRATPSARRRGERRRAVAER